MRNGKSQRRKRKKRQKGNAKRRGGGQEGVDSIGKLVFDVYSRGEGGGG